MTSFFGYFCTILIRKKAMSKKLVFANECIVSQCLGVIIRKSLSLKILELVVFMHKCRYSNEVLSNHYNKQIAMTSMQTVRQRRQKQVETACRQE